MTRRRTPPAISTGSITTEEVQHADARHAGDLIKTEIVEELRLTVKKAAEILKVRRATLSRLLHGKAALTPDMASRIEKAFGPD